MFVDQTLYHSHIHTTIHQNIFPHLHGEKIREPGEKLMTIIQMKR